MAINNSTTGSTYINLGALNGTGESTMFVDEVVGVLVGIEVREGTYEVTDRKTGQKIQRPNSWVSHWSTPEGEKLMSWPTYQDQDTKMVCPWSRFDPSINLQQCSSQGIMLHFWKDERNFYHLEVAEATNLNPMPVMAAAPQVQTQPQPVVQAAPAVAPWVR